jgi:thiol-disulfide isomerase/thioredoxin
MTRVSLLSGILTAWLLFGSQAIAAESLVWETDLPRAQLAAAQSNRLVLVHFTASYCAWCKWMDTEVFTQPAVIKQIQANYVPVKIDAEKNRDLVKKYNIGGLPSEVILTSQGQVVNVAKGKADATQYVAYLDKCVTNVRQSSTALLAVMPLGIPNGNPNNAPNATPNPYTPQPITPAPAYGQAPVLNGPAHGSSNNIVPPSAAQAPQPSLMSPNNNLNNANLNNNNPLPNGVASRDGVVINNPLPNAAMPPAMPPNQQPLNPQPTMNQPVNVPANAAPLVNPPMNPPANVMLNSPTNIPMNGPANVPPKVGPQQPAVNPQYGLDGYCAVTLSEKQQWVRGNIKWGVNHLGRVYLFAGPEEQRRFLADFDRYAPFASGIDIVLAVDEHKIVPGKREHGEFYSISGIGAERILLFTSEATLQRFNANPSFYLSQFPGSVRANPAVNPQVNQPPSQPVNSAMNATMNR